MVQILPFRHHALLSGVSGKLPHHCNDDVASFYAALAKSLDNLERLAATEFLSFEFATAAVDALRASHSGAVHLVEKLRLRVSAGSEEWLNEYMDETVKLLDVCNVIKTALGGFEEYHSLVGMVVRALPEAVGENGLRPYVHRALHALNACRQEMVQIEAEHRALVEPKIDAGGGKLVNVVALADRHVENKFVKWNGFWGVLFALKCTSSYVARLLLCALVHAGPLPALNTDTVSSTSTWSHSLVRLDHVVAKETAGTKTAGRLAPVLSSEVETLEGALAVLRKCLQPARGPNFRNMADGCEQVNVAVQTLTKTSQKLQMGLEAVEWHVNDLFDDIVEGRNKLLNLSYSCCR